VSITSAFLYREGGGAKVMQAHERHPDWGSYGRFLLDGSRLRIASRRKAASTGMPESMENHAQYLKEYRDGKVQPDNFS